MSGKTTLLNPPPKQGRGIKRLNRVPIYGITAAVMVVGGAIGYTYHERMVRAELARASNDRAAQGAGDHANGLFPDQPSPPADIMPEPPAVAPPPPREAKSAPATDLAEEARIAAWKSYYKRFDQRLEAADDETGKALTAATNDTGNGVADSAAVPQTAPSANGANAGLPVPDSGTGSGGLPVAGVDASAQAEKRAFLRQGGDTLGLTEDLRATLHAPKYDAVMEGTAIPGIMVGGLTSDMPGMVVGSIAQNIYDTATGTKLLIPQGSRVVGAYDNSVSNGQERIGVIWNRIIFPDTTSIQLGSMEGADQGGYAGFHDQVNSHFWEKFWSATIISIAGAAAQLSQPQQSAFQGYSSSSVATAAMTQGYSELGRRYAEAGLSIPNTIEIRPGYQFTIMVNKDMHLPAYVDHRTAQAPSNLGPILQ
jgi:type IV secretory pathway VirB10-like protein